MYNYSFIIPHKNCPALLQRCVDSIPERDNVQVIVVDDNSDEDKKPSLKERKNLQVVQLDAIQSKGAGRARNVGLKHAEGKWLLFADADDYYTDYLPNLLDKYVDDDTTDIVFLNACVFDENGAITPYKTERLIRDYLDKEEGAEMELRYNLWTPWSRMVKNTIIESHQIRYDEFPAGNDVMFGLKSSRYANSLQVEQEVIYKYYKPSRGSCTDAARKQMLESRLALRANIINLYKEVGYSSNTNLLEVLCQYLRTNKSFYTEALKKYRECLHLYNISIFSDIYYFFVRRL